MKTIQKISFVFIVLVAFCMSVFIPSSAENPDNSEVNGDYKTNTYFEYLSLYKEKNRPKREFEAHINETSLLSNEVVINTNYESREGNSVFTGENSQAQWRVFVEEAGLYSIAVTYFPAGGKGGSIERALSINGKTPFIEAEALVFSRIWVDDEVFLDGEGNELRPNAVEKRRWITADCIDNSGFYSESLLFYFEEGENKIALKAAREPMVVGGIKIYNDEKMRDFEEIKTEYKNKGYSGADYEVKIQAEDYSEKSDIGIFAECDRHSTGTEPYALSSDLLNKISSKWQVPAQWIKWDFNVEESGIYNIVVRYRQSTRDGAFCSRKVLIDEKLLYSEMGTARFEYTDRWKVKAISTAGGEALKVYLNEGLHSITMQAVLGDLSEIVAETQSELLQLNKIYRKIIMFTGADPDVHRDYHFQKQMPEVMDEMNRSAIRLREMAARLEAAAGKGSATAAFEKLAFDLEVMNKNPRKIASKLDSFKANLGFLATWLADSSKQPIELDWISVQGENKPIPKADKGFWANLWHQVQMFFHSFTAEYNEKSNSQQKAIKVWLGNGISGGRDQAQIIKRMVDRDFSVRHHIKVNFELVSTGTLLPATLSGTVPDVALQLANTEPMNYAMRGAVVDLSEYQGFQEVAGRFNENALVPYTYKSKVFALPETFTFPMLFYRTDIFKELKLEPPDTWDDVFDSMIALGMNDMKFGMPADFYSFGMLLYQNGGEFYDKEGKKSTLDSKLALKSFEMWTRFYSEYSSPVMYDFANRFRTGEMPVAIADLEQFNQLSVFAPEIKGLWKMVPVPGILRADKTVNRSVASKGVGCVIMQQSGAKDEAWEFLKWWTGTEAQTAYGKELESVLGVAARYPTANKEAAALIAWSSADYKNIMSQWDEARGVQELPGSYITARYVDFAFKSVVSEEGEATKQMLYYVEQINDELARKRKEFGID